LIKEKVEENTYTSWETKHNKGKDKEQEEKEEGGGGGGVIIRRRRRRRKKNRRRRSRKIRPDETR
jgi:hypothetical protein